MHPSGDDGSIAHPRRTGQRLNAQGHEGEPMSTSEGQVTEPQDEEGSAAVAVEEDEEVTPLDELEVEPNAAIFAALEEPQALAADIRAFFRPLHSRASRAQDDPSTGSG